MIKVLDKEYPNLRIEEFVSRHIFTAMRANSIRLLDQTILDIAQGVRNWYDAPIVINNWHNAGTFQNRGFRAANSTVGATYSQHKFGRAIDINVRGITPQRMYKDIMDDKKYFMDIGVTCIEDIAHTPTWIHLDCRITNLLNDILIVKP